MDTADRGRFSSLGEERSLSQSRGLLILSCTYINTHFVLAGCRTAVAAAASVIAVWVETSAAGKEQLVLRTNGRSGPLGLEHSWGHLGHWFQVVYANSISQHLK